MKTHRSSPLPRISDMAKGICMGGGVLGYAGGLDVITGVLRYTTGSRRVRIRDGRGRSLLRGRPESRDEGSFLLPRSCKR